jgi:hypothetical protein
VDTVPTEQCARCGETVSLDDTVHIMVNAMDHDGVIDGYVCGTCYDDRFAILDG